MPRLDRRQRYLEGLTAALMKLGVVPGLADVTKLSVEQRHASGPAKWMTFPIPDGVTCHDSEAPARGGRVPLRVYRPARIDGTRPPMLYIHGGGFVNGGPPSCHWLCAELSARLSTEVVSVDYRLAPEHRYPAGLDDCADALASMDAPQVVVAGDSAGGNLAAALALRDRDGARRIAQQLLIYPALDLTMGSPSITEGRSRVLTPEALAAVADHYLGPDGDRTDALASPLLAPSLAGLPPAVILTAEHDPLRDDGARYAARLEQEGVPVQYRNYGTAGHGFFSTPRLVRESARALDDLVALARRQLQEA